MKWMVRRLKGSFGEVALLEINGKNLRVFRCDRRFPPHKWICTYGDRFTGGDTLIKAVTHMRQRGVAVPKTLPKALSNLK